MAKWIKRLLCKHNWKWEGNSVWKENPMVVMFKSHYTCEKCQKQKVVFQNQP